MSKLDFAGLRAQIHGNILGHLQAWLPGGRKEGNEYVVTNPTRADMKRGSFKINVRTGKWADYAAGDGASGRDLIDLYAYLKGIGPGDAYKDLTGDTGEGLEIQQRSQGTKKKQVPDETFTPLPLPEDAPAMPKPPGSPERVHIFHDAAGRAVLREVVYRKKAGMPKIPVPTSWGHHVKPKMVETPDGGEEWTGDLIETRGWCKKNWPDNRPIYNLHHLMQRPDAIVYIAEGAKKADRIAKALGNGVVTSAWIGGANGLEKTNWRTVVNRKVVIWPDYDLPGQKAALQLAKILREQGCEVELVWEPLNEQRHPEGWDVADLDDDLKLKDMLDGALAFETVETIVLESKKIEGDAAAALTGMSASLAAEYLDNQDELRCLGYSSDNRVYFMSRRRGVMVGLAPNDLGNLSHLLTLHDLKFWYQIFPDKRGGFDKHKAADGLQRWAENSGYFDGKRLRGRGVWIEANGDVVFHTGQKLIIKDQVVPIHSYRSNHVYEVKPDMGVTPVKPLDTEQAKRLIDACSFLNWEVPVYGRLLAGFCMVATVCGGMEWRPHIWITGESGSGKTTALKEIVQRVLNRLSAQFIGGSTAPGIRQSLSGDAIPVLIDELEGETQQQRDELQKILQLARISSSEAGARMVKGGQGGEAVEFLMRSCFVFMGIQVNVLQSADRNRITVLNLKGFSADRTKEEVMRDEQAFTKYQAELKELLTEEYINRLHIRAYALLPVIRDNADMFKRAIILKTKNSRTGDQLGTLAAGCYALESVKRVTLEEAVAWVEAQKWESIVSFDELKDHDRCLTYILQSRVRLQGDKGIIERTLGELVEKVAKAVIVDAHEEVRVLRSYGIKVNMKEKTLIVANDHTELERLMKVTPYQVWAGLLKRITGAKPTGTEYFGAGSSNSRATAIPLDVVLRPGVVSVAPEFSTIKPHQDELEIPL